MNTILSSLSMVLRNTKNSLIYVSTAAITFGLEELFGCLIFSCPCDGHLVYGLAFLFAPAFLLFIPGVLLQRKLWTYQGTLDAYETHTRTRHYVKVLSIAFDLFVKVSIAPISWLVLSLLNQQYFTCAFFGPSLENKAFANTSDNCFKLESRSKELEENYKARSQVTGLALLLIASLLLFIKICICKCAFEGKRLQLPIPPESPNYESQPDQDTTLEHVQRSSLSEEDGVGEKREHCIEMERLDRSKQSHVPHETPDYIHEEHTEAGSYCPRGISFVKFESENGRDTVLWSRISFFFNLLSYLA